MIAPLPAPACTWEAPRGLAPNPFKCHEPGCGQVARPKGTRGVLFWESQIKPPFYNFLAMCCQQPYTERQLWNLAPDVFPGSGFGSGIHGDSALLQALGEF